MPNQVVQLKQIGNITFSKNRRSKNIKISVKPDKSVLVSYPFYVSSKEVFAFVVKNELWIRTQQEKMELRKSKIEPNSEVKTKQHNVTFRLGDKNRIVKKGAEVTIVVTNFDEDECQAFIEHYLTEVYRIEAKTLLPVRLAELAELYDFKYNRVTIRNNRRNWGSCSSQNNISLNLQMIKLPDELIDYILLHELVHTEIKNHSANFWNRLNEITNNRARELAGKVRQYSTYTL